MTPQGEKPAPRLKAAPEPAQAIDKSELQPEPEPEPKSVVEEANFYMIDKLHYDENVLVEETELYGEFNFRDTILDQLDRYWFYLDRMRKHDADAYGFYKQVGAVMVPHVVLRSWEDNEHEKATPEEIQKYKDKIFLPPSFKQNRPSFGCIAYGTNSVVEQREAKHEGRLSPRFIYYTKCSRPSPDVQPMTGGDTYKIVVWWDRALEKKWKWGKPTEFAVHINTAGDEIHVLRLLRTNMIDIKEKKGLKHFSIPKRAWIIPEFYKEWASEHGIPVEMYLAGLFCDAAKILENSQLSTLRVAVHKDNMTAVFGIDPRRMSYFFRDRDYKLNANGHRIPVFHIVKPYVRSDGVAVKMQFRGDRDFTWAGYRVTITVPGLDHFLLSELNIGTVDSYWQEKGKKYLTEPEFGEKLVQYMEQGVGAHKP